jgi:ABC-type Fe3+/spermidine/putrescine transport system ATPase subunit
MIQVQDLQEKRGGFTLHVPNLEAAAGEYLVLLGPSGAGKSLLLGAVAGLYPVRQGRILLGGEDVTARPPERRDVGLVAQSPGLFPHLTVRQNVAFGLRYRRARRAALEARMAQLVDLLDLGSLLDRGVRDLSGGEQQRVALARMLTVEPRVLLLDEPLGRLDHNTREELRRELRRLHEALGTTTLHVTHDRADAFALADRVAILGGGRIHQVGPVAEVFSRPVNEFVARFVGVENFFPATADQGDREAGRQGDKETGRQGDRRVQLDDIALVAVADLTGPVWVCVRPEAIRLLPTTQAPPPGMNCLRGDVRLLRAEGPLVRVELEVGAQPWVILCDPQSVAGAGLTVGDCAQAIFAPEDVHVFGRERNLTPLGPSREVQTVNG